MQTAEIIYTGDLSCLCRHLQSGDTIRTDAPTDNFGKGSAFSPTDLMSVALATCIITTIGIRLRNENININDSKIQVLKIMSSNLPRRIAEINIVIHVSGIHSKVMQDKMIAIAHDCPVAHSLHPDIKQDVTFEFSSN